MDGGGFHGARLLKRELGIDTFLATDGRRGEVLIKTLPAAAVSAAARGHFEYEIARLGELRECAIAHDLELRSEDGQLKLVRPFVRGQTLAERQARGPLSIHEVIELGIDLLSTLEKVHAAGVVHRDIKPSNVVLAEDRRAVLVDFVLPRHAWLSAPAAELLPTAVHLAPEQAGLIDRGVDARADLYALGLLLYQAATGRPPFSGATLSEILHQQLSARPPPLRASVPDAPAALEAILDRLLRKDPRDRYQTAEGARADLEQLRASLERGAEVPEIVIGGVDRRRTLTEPAFIGRERELAALEAALVEASRGRGGLVRIEGESGAGKTALLEELLRRVAHRGVWALHARGVRDTAPRPFQTLSITAQEIAATPDRGRELGRRLGPYVAVVCESLPALRGVFGAAESRTDPTVVRDLRGDERSRAALAALVHALGTPERPALLLLDDGQWADAETLRLLERWQSDGAGHVLCVLAFRSEDADAAHPVRALRPLFDLRLAPLEPHEVRQEVASMAGRLPPPAVDAVIAHAGGNPFLAAALVHGLVECGALRATADGFQLDSEALDQLQVSGRIADILASRLAALGDETRGLLAVGAVLGRRFDPALAGALAGLPPRRAIETIERVRGKLVWADASGGTYSFLHDRIRETLLGGLSEIELRRLHLAAAEHIETADPGRLFELAYHFDAAGAHARALPYALAAAEQARSRFDLSLAAAQYAIAARGASGADNETRHRLARGYAEVLILRNQHEQARRQLDEALALVPDTRARAAVEELGCQLEMKRGQLEDACRHAEEALRLIGRPVPGSTAACTFLCLWEALVQVLHSYFPRLLVGRRKVQDADPDELFAMRIYYSLSGPYFFARGAVWASWAHLRNLNLSERYEVTPERGRAYAVHASVLSGFPSLFPRGLRHTRDAIAIAERTGDLWGRGRAFMFHSMVLHFSGRHRESLEAALEGARLLDRIGDRWEANTALCFAAMSQYRLGDLQGAAETGRMLADRGNDVGGMHAVAWGLMVWALATDGVLPAERVREAVERCRDHLQSSTIIAQAEAVRLLAAGQPEEALEVVERSLHRIATEARYFHDQNAPLLIYRVAALRALAEQTSPLDPRRRAQLLKRAERAVRPALEIARKFRNNLPHALREAARVAALRGRTERALALLDESIALAVATDARHERARSLAARAELRAALGKSGGAAELDRAHRDLAALRPQPTAEPPVTLSLVDRFETIVDAGRKLATALEPDAIHAQLCEAARTLLRADQCLVLGGPAMDFRPLHGDVATPLRRELCAEAIASGRAILRPEGALVRGLPRSALCIPIKVGGEAIACLYAAHREVEDLFTPEDERIAWFLTTLAGAALENADNFAKLSALSRELETRVSERTAELARANEELSLKLTQLRETQDQLLRAGRMAAVGTLIAGLSHELNNPIAVILGYAELLVELTPREDRARGPIEAIHRQAERAGRLIRTLLGFSRSEPAQREPLTVESILESVEQLFAGQARTRQLDLRIEVGERLPPLVASAQEIESALLNLLSNAADVTPERGTIALSVSAETRGGTPGVLFAVRDTGPGIPADVLPHIFDPFFTTKPVGEGTGLGLAITRQIVIGHGGQIDIQTGPEGTTVLVWLPAAQDGA